ncbi:uncharacterized protein FSUBG_12339 [Fusarium subglutinans]|uniref:Uncharacterized protein n=1 Tax=Gibberella subglutinans TaxID=42677 RepID=A0A8H5L3N2_GIBSU|nr:uncharacterized protein FSUBG_12339 [Fusarium subglutinans]KAF5585750.1 hypothetical protein FSUBG_12339 [Fusarium subglutinans]
MGHTRTSSVAFIVPVSSVPKPHHLHHLTISSFSRPIKSVVKAEGCYPTYVHLRTLTDLANPPLRPKDCSQRINILRCINRPLPNFQHRNSFDIRTKTSSQL